MRQSRRKSWRNIVEQRRVHSDSICKQASHRMLLGMHSNSLLSLSPHSHLSSIIFSRSTRFSTTRSTSSGHIAKLLQLTKFSAQTLLERIQLRLFSIEKFCCTGFLLANYYQEREKLYESVECFRASNMKRLIEKGREDAKVLHISGHLT